MCGIAGWVDYNESLRGNGHIFGAMSETLKNRGPDAGGIYTEENVCLIHRRLAVIDPENGAQPMEYAGAGERYILVYNGELYNTDELRRRLKNAGHGFAGHSDTEVVLHAYAEWGSDCLDMLNGIYAFAIWDSKRKTLFAARDRMGVKPIFIYPYKEGLVFASQIKTLLKNPHVRPLIDEEGLKSVFLLGPGRVPGNGVVKGVVELKPGEFAVFNKAGLKFRRYWSLKAAEHTDRLEDTVEKTRFLIRDAITRQLVSDVPLCCFLSGGLDSSIICKTAALNCKERGDRLTTYSVNYRDNSRYFAKSLFQPDSDEEYIRMMSEDIGSDHREVVLENRMLAQSLGDAAIAREFPGMADIDSSLLLFCREIKKDFTVALSGECADGSDIVGLSQKALEYQGFSGCS